MKSLYSDNILTHVDKIPVPKQGLNHAPYTSLAKLKIVHYSDNVLTRADEIPAPKHGVNLTPYTTSA